MDIELKNNERIDDLQLNNFKIIQNKEAFCFGIDSILLTEFSKNIKTNSRVLDLGSGTGILSILLCGKTKLKEIIGVEIQKEVYEMSQRSIKLNNLENKIRLINDNILNLNKYFDSNSFDVIVTNPPYKKQNSGIKNQNEKKLISRHEITAKLEDFISIGSMMLKEKGEFYMVHRPERLVDILTLMRKYNIEPKLLKLTCINKDKVPKLVLIKGVKNANPFLNIKI